MIGSINGWEIGILLVVVLLIVGPERLPAFAAQLGRLVREVRAIATGASSRLKEEMGDSFDELRDLDPRQYDPRRIVREALFDEPSAAAPRAASRYVPAAGAAAAAAAAGATPAPASPAPYDDEAT